MFPTVWKANFGVLCTRVTGKPRRWKRVCEAKRSPRRGGGI